MKTNTNHKTRAGLYIQYGCLAASLTLFPLTSLQAEPSSINEVKVQERKITLEIEETIEGQQAQPKLLFILPWQAQKEMELKLTRGQLIDRNFLSPIERESFQHETRLIQKLK